MRNAKGASQPDADAAPEAAKHLGCANCYQAADKSARRHPDQDSPEPDLRQAHGRQSPSDPSASTGRPSAGCQGAARTPGTAHSRNPAKAKSTRQAQGKGRSLTETSSPTKQPIHPRAAKIWPRRKQATRQTSADRVERRGLIASSSLKHQGAVGTAKTKVVLHRIVDLHVTRRVSAVIKITFRILIEDIDGRW